MLTKPSRTNEFWNGKEKKLEYQLSWLKAFFFFGLLIGATGQFELILSHFNAKLRANVKYNCNCAQVCGQSSTLTTLWA